MPQGQTIIVDNRGTETTMNKAIPTIVILGLSLFHTILGFSAVQRPHVAIKNVATIVTTAGTSLHLTKMGDENSEGEFPPEEDIGGEYTGSVDWDAEWKKVVASDGKLKDGQDRPGKDFYKSEAEIAAIKAANKASRAATEVTSSIGDSLPDIRSLSGDWKVRMYFFNLFHKDKMLQCCAFEFQEHFFFFFLFLMPLLFPPNRNGKKIPTNI